MARFSERYGYVKPSDVIIREDMPLSVQNAICTCFDRLKQLLISQLEYDKGIEEYRALECYLWVYFLNEREGNYSYRNPIVTTFLENNKRQWYQKLDLVEYAIKYLFYKESRLDGYYRYRSSVAKAFVSALNSHFERLHFAYRVIDKQIVEITSKEEITAIETAMQNSTDNIKMHLSKALELYSKRPMGDYGNSIKESISAVEAFCRAKTGTDDLGSALAHLKTSGVNIPKSLNTAFKTLYGYTNKEETGIRHALMDTDGTYTPSEDEALFMLVACSAFINYLGKKAG
ncbi:MAG: AbiJ-NTD4 domain-containing protein [Hoylesella shahii]|uniref:AbiJ-NTD4 domain-containing protein n=1 Tax=Hoylesella shahii TaxID=228603 RepID=UPI003F9F6A95